MMERSDVCEPQAGSGRRIPSSALSVRRALLVLACAGAVGCGGDDTTGTPEDVDVSAGATAVVAIINPVVNEPHGTGVPAELGDARDGIVVAATPGGRDITAGGIAVVGAPAGGIELDVSGATLSHTIQAEGDVVDAPIAFSGSAAAFFDNTPIRYAVSEASGAIFLDPSVPMADLEARLAEDGRVVVLRPGRYVGSITITGRGTLLYGEGFLERAVIIDGGITVQGEAVRLRGLTITGDLASRGNDFGISFSVVRGNVSITGNAGAFVRNVFCGETVVPSSNATLLDNHGVAPLNDLPPVVCD
ncbi:uncharacterized protein SOCEGT47_045210 [Sorangium cellulosum]|uniref:Uncharacterized protein n=1 Tax=Sorangium cellulosum TaxID=56 RepID=A0A4P2Q3R9_SORCE|nr:hypothetical protein [Sorangium cellulosum]AUX23990.1 uncharacterized protein SOCEGT47_045210 [Sorangium cellulosum]